MRPLRTPSAAQIDAALAVLRVVVGIIFLAHGYQKLFVFGFAGITGFFTQIGAPLPGISGPAVSLLEFFGGIALVGGLLTRVVALGLAADMFGAIVIVHFQGGFFLPKGYEFVLLLMAASLTLALAGAGRYSLDARLSARA